MYSLVSFLRTQPKNTILHAMSLDKNYLNDYGKFLRNKNCRYVVKPIETYQMVLIDDVPDYMHNDFCVDGVRFAISDEYRDRTQIVHAGCMYGGDYGREDCNIYLIGLNYYGFVRIDRAVHDKKYVDCSKHFVVMFHYNREVVDCEAIIREMVIVQNDVVCIEQVRKDFEIHHRQLTKPMKTCCYLSEKVFDVDAYYDNGIITPMKYVKINKQSNLSKQNIDEDGLDNLDANLTPEERKAKYVKMGESIVDTIKSMVDEANKLQWDDATNLNVDENAPNRADVVVESNNGMVTCKTMHVTGKNVSADKLANALAKKLPNENIRVVKTKEGHAVAINAPVHSTSSAKIVEDDVVLPSIKSLCGNGGFTDLFEKPKSKLFAYGV